MDKQQFIEDFVTAAGAPVIDRKTVIKLSGGLIGSTKTLANLDSLGLGCKAQVRLGKRVGYETRPLSIWLFNRLQVA
jgi:hypothetical protein